MTLFVISVLVVLLMSVACSVSEAALYAVRRMYVRQIAEKGSRPGTLLLRFKGIMKQHDRSSALNSWRRRICQAHEMDGRSNPSRTVLAGWIETKVNE